MGKKKFNLCTKCNFRHAAPTGKGCLAGDGEQALDKPIEDEKVQGGQVPSRVGLDNRCNSPKFLEKQAHRTRGWRKSNKT